MRTSQLFDLAAYADIAAEWVARLVCVPLKEYASARRAKRPRQHVRLRGWSLPRLLTRTKRQALRNGLVHVGSLTSLAVVGILQSLRAGELTPLAIICLIIFCLDMTLTCLALLVKEG